ncbi:MAG TPA: DUF2779 domain-containing protein [Candidatus Angelobacter sp.]|nr:DUF2779 domain-containing protein [Candidatus Angelobacter sp.]
MEQLPLWGGRSTVTPRLAIPLLSKSRFMAGLQCPKRLYLECYEGGLREPLSPATRALFEAGSRVGLVARGLFAGGVKIGEEGAPYDQVVRETHVAIARPEARAIYEAAFLHDNMRVRVDILAPAGGGAWDLIEVKSSSGFKEEYLPDVGIQLHVLEGAGVPIRRVCVVHVNSQYVYEGGPYVLERLFAVRDVTAEARKVLPKLRAALEQMRAPLWAWEPPDTPVGPQCKKPYVCPFHTHCHRDGPEFPIEKMPRLNPKLLRALREADIDDIRDIPEDFEGLTDLHRRIRASIITGRIHQDPELKQALAGLTPPVHFLDFETCNPALPRFVGTRPFQQVPFQWSDHVIGADGLVAHHEFLHREESDPRVPLVTALVSALGTEGPIVVYSGFEARIVRALADEVPARSAELHAIADRMVDLLELIRAHYYHPDFKGSFSIKDVLPALIEDLDYDDLEIREGSQAATGFIEMIDGGTSAEKRKALQCALLAYCKRDTEAMVRLFQKLREGG